MKTPIYDFVKEYAEGSSARFHMPGHKGVSFLGCEAYDITEIRGADVLSAPCGIIAESELNASSLFGTAASLYSTEGSTLAIKAMLATAVCSARAEGRAARVLAARGVHKAFVYAAALVGFDIDWIYHDTPRHLCCAAVSADDVARALARCSDYAAVYITSPDYLGNLSDIEGISRVCRRAGVPLLVDNAHGAYLAFLKDSMHPITLGADMCSDSAHKTLPVLTGGAYLHISKKAPSDFISQARNKLAIFSSTSPSYLILQSLDLCNRYISNGYRDRLASCIARLGELKHTLNTHGIATEQSEPLKLVVAPETFGYRGDEISEYLSVRGIETEFSDGEYLVLMVTPENTEQDFSRLEDAMLSLPRKNALMFECFDEPCRPESVISVREAVFSPSETVRAEDSEGRICASVTVACPPAVPIVISGERIDNTAVSLFEKYGIETVSVVK